MKKRSIVPLLAVLALSTTVYGQSNPNAAQQAITYNSLKYPHDWTEGTGALTGTEIDVPSPVAGNTIRRWIYVQNQSAATLKVEYESRLANGTTQVFPVILLAPGAATGSQGANDERGFAAFVPQGIVKVIGASGAQVAILEVTE